MASSPMKMERQTTLPEAGATRPAGKASEGIISLEIIRGGGGGCIDLARPAMADSSMMINRTLTAARFEPSQYARRTSAGDVEEEIDRIWKAKCERNPRLFNGSKFRLAGLEVLEGKLVLAVGLTCYKDMCGTNFASNFRAMQDKGEKDFGDRQAYISDPVGSGVLLTTSDGFLVLTRRADWTGEYPGALDRPGGHPEPQRVFKDDGSLRPELDDVDDAVIQEMWSSVVKEAEDEMGVSKDKMREFAFLGVTFNVEAGCRPSLEFYARLSLNSTEVEKEYRKGDQEEADESSELFLVPPEAVARLPALLLPRNSLFPSERRPDVTGDSEKEAQEAEIVLKEATPALKGAILLASNHRLLPSA